MSNDKIMQVPVHREPKSFAEHHRNQMTTLGGQPLDLFDNDWSNQVNQRIDACWRSLDDEMRRMRHNMFQLMPIETFGLPRWDGLHALNNPFGLMHEMEDDMWDMRNRLGSWDEAPLVACSSDFLKDAYQLGEDGKLHFNARFDVHGFTPEDINVTCNGNQLSVHAKQLRADGSSKSSREFCRIIELPRSIDAHKLQSRLTNDGVLMLEAPVTNADYKSLTFDDKGRVGVRPKTEAVGNDVASKALVVRGSPGLSIVDSVAGGKRLHVEVPVDAGFDAKDLSVNVDSHRITVSGKRHDKNKWNRGCSQTQAEFSYSYALPETVDPMTIDAAVMGNTLVVDAPLTKTMIE